MAPQNHSIQYEQGLKIGSIGHKEDAYFASIRQKIREHPSNDWTKELGYEPIYTASAQSKIVIIGQAPGIKAQTSRIPWDDASGKTLRKWLGISDDDFYDPDKVALIPMDFYYPGKGKSGDLPLRKDFAPMWHAQLLEHMPHIQLTLLIGNYAQKHYLGASMQRNLTETVRSYDEYLPVLMPIVHPSPLASRWRKQNPWFEATVVPELQRIVKAYLP